MAHPSCEKINGILSVNGQVTKTVWHTLICILKTSALYRSVRTYTVLLFGPLSKKIKHQIVDTGNLSLSQFPHCNIWIIIFPSYVQYL